MRTGRWMRYWMVVGMAAQILVAGRALAADAGLEFGVEDDLSVNGTEGTLQDADLEVKGYSLFGSTNGLTVPAAFTAGPGSVVIASNLYVNGQVKAGTIDMSGAAMTVSNLTVEGFLHAQGDNLDVLKDATLQKSLSIGETLNVTGAASLGSTLGVTGNGSIGGTLGVTGAATLGNTLDVTGATTLGSTLGVTGNGTVGGTLGVTGATTLGNTLNVSGAATLGNGLNVTGLTTLSSNLLVNSTLDSSDAATGALVVLGGGGFAKNVNVGGGLGVTGNGTVGGTLGVTGNSTLGGTLGVTGNTTLSGTLGVTGTTTLSSDMTAAQSAYLATTAGAVGIGTAAPDANTKIQVAGGTNSNDYVAKFYSGSTLAAWIKKK